MMRHLRQIIPDIKDAARDLKDHLKYKLTGRAAPYDPVKERARALVRNAPSKWDSTSEANQKITQRIMLHHGNHLHSLYGHAVVPNMATSEWWINHHNYGMYAMG